MALQRHLEGRNEPPEQLKPHWTRLLGTRHLLFVWSRLVAAGLDRLLTAWGDGAGDVVKWWLQWSGAHAETRICCGQDGDDPTGHQNVMWWQDKRCDGVEQSIYIMYIAAVRKLAQGAPGSRCCEPLPTESPVPIS